MSENPFEAGGMRARRAPSREGTVVARWARWAGAADTPPWDDRHMLLDQLARVTDRLRSSVADLDPERLSGADAARLLAAFAEIERLASAGKLLSARRVESSNVWRRSGHRSAAAHVADATGTGIGPAITALETARHLGSLPATDEAVRQGKLSETQVNEIAGAAILQPGAEQSLVDAAGKQPLSVLKLRCKRVRATGRDQGATYEAIRRSRYLRHWVEDNGAVRFDARLTPDEGARLAAAVAGEADRLVAAARKAGLDEPRKSHGRRCAGRPGHRTSDRYRRPVRARPESDRVGFPEHHHPRPGGPCRPVAWPRGAGRTVRDPRGRHPSRGGRPSPGRRLDPQRPRHRRRRRHRRCPRRPVHSHGTAKGAGRTRPGVRGSRM